MVIILQKTIAAVPGFQLKIVTYLFIPVIQPLQPSIYDSIIEIKKLPNIPDIKRTRHYNVTAGDILCKNVLFITTQTTYMELRELMRKSVNASFALVDKVESMVLLGR